jgi:hypothetical protein
MPKATFTGGRLAEINDCYIDIPDAGRIVLNNLPDVSDTKSAEYNDEAIIGRSFPLKTFSHSGNRAIGMTLHFFVTDAQDIYINLHYLRMLESCVYPRKDAGSGAPFVPPPVCQIKVGRLLGEKPLCCIMKSYNAKLPPDVSWDEKSLVPYKFDVDTSWEVVYNSLSLPGAEWILEWGS